MSFKQFKEYGTGRCINCGYLGKKDTNVHTSECYEASTFERISGTLLKHMGAPTDPSTHRPQIQTFPWCFVGKAYIHDEVDARFAEMEGKEDKTVCVFNVISKSRDCPSWYPWREFATPKEHFEKSMMLAMEQKREEFEKQMEQDKREFELKLFNMNKKLTTNSNRVMIGLAIGAIIFAAAQVFFAAAVINPDHWLFGWLR